MLANFLSISRILNRVNFIVNHSELENYFKPILELAIKEDIGNKDITSDAILTTLGVPTPKIAKGKIIAKDNAILCGLPVVDYIFNYQTDAIKNSKFFFSEGASVNNGDTVYEITGNMGRLLSFERIALNILQRLSGIASKTRSFVESLEGKKKPQILDTRKTMPGYRMLEKYAVKIGGAGNHRSGLYDMFIIKDNHIKLAGGITEAIKAVRIYAKKNALSNLKIEVECQSLEQVKKAKEQGVDVIMLDNMPDSSIRNAIKIISGNIKTEISGNITLGKVANLGRLDINFISVGSITHSVLAKDFSMDVESLVLTE